MPAITFGHLTHTLSPNTVWDVRVGRFVADEERPPSTGDKDDPCYQPDQPDSWPDRILAIEKAAVTAGISDLR